MSRRIKVDFVTDFSKSNNAKFASKSSVGANSNSFSQATAARQPVAKSRGNANSAIKETFASAVCDGSSYMSLASSETIGSFDSGYTVVFVFVNADYTNDTYFVSSSTGNGYIGIKAGGGDIIYKPAASKASEKTFVTDTANGGSVSHTFGTGMEMVAFVSDGNNTINVYNIDGDLITTDTGSGNSANFPVDHILGRSDGTRGLDGEILDISIYNVALDTHLIKGLGNRFKQFKS
jgi:hypothetical protein